MLYWKSKIKKVNCTPESGHEKCNLEMYGQSKTY